ncbi:hypothetical protein OAD67_01045 [bacterium]|nr:hypothetical protein [bacterium]
MASSCALAAGVSVTRARATPSSSASASRRPMGGRRTHGTSCVSPSPIRSRVVVTHADGDGDPQMLWDDEQRKFVDGGTTKTSLDDPCLQGLTITPPRSNRAHS